MKAKYKVTGCFKFVLVLIILAPIAYIGASYFNGQDGIQNFRDLIGLSAKDDPPQEASVALDDLESQMEDLRKELSSAKEETERLQDELEACQSATDQ